MVDTTFVDIYVDTKNIPTCRYNIQHIDKRTMENKMSIIMWEAAMSYATTFKWKNETSLGPKRRIVTNWEPYFVVYFQITLVSQRHSLVLVKKHAHFMLLSSPSVHALCYTRHVGVITVTGLPFDQMEPSCSMQTRSGNPVRTPKSERDFPDFWIEFYAGFYEWVNDRLMTNNYKQYLPLPECILDYSFKLTLNHLRITAKWIGIKVSL